MNNIAIYLKCLIEETGISQAELSRRSRVARATITRILQGRARGSLISVDKLLEVFGCRLTVRRIPDRSTDYDRASGKRKLPYDDPLENNPKLEVIKNERQRTPRP